jgi:hypothetical protein
MKEDAGVAGIGEDSGRGAHNEVIGKGEKFEGDKLDEAKIVRELPNDVTGVHWKELGELVLLLICFRYLGGVAEILFWDPFVTGQ